jgi:hypothetical protein
VGTDDVLWTISWLVAVEDVPEGERRIGRLACFSGFAFFTARWAAVDRFAVT